MQASPDLDLSADQVESQFEQLQRKLVPLWQLIGRTDPGGPLEDANTIVVVPSLSMDIDIPSSMQQAYEERFLFMLFTLQQPLIRIIFITSQAIDPGIVDYYLHIVPGVIASNARKRLALVTPLDGSSRPLTEKLLERPRLLQRIRSLISDPDRAHLVPYNSTVLERELAVRLGIPMYAADPRFFALGTRSGGRRVFAEEGVPHPVGFEDLFSTDDIVGAIVRMRAQKPSMAKVIVKLNEAVGGLSSAIVDLEDFPPPGYSWERHALAERLRAMRFESEAVHYDAFLAKLVQGGAIVEELIDGEQIHHPSAQLRVSPLGEVELLSTHDHLPGGTQAGSNPSIRFPADPAYAPRIMREAAKIGQRFAREGIVGRFALDFAVGRSASGEWEPYAVEVNLGKGGTTHPFLTLQYLTDGRYDPESGLFTTARGHQKSYVASDQLESPRYRAFTPDDLFDLVSRHRLHFDHTSQSGVVLHLLSGIGQLGRLGVTAIADTPADAEALYARFIAVLDENASPSP